MNWIDFCPPTTFEESLTVFEFEGLDNSGMPSLGPPLATGHEMHWFGASLNANNFVEHTGNVEASTLSTPSQTIDLHFADHASSTGGNPFVFGVPPFAEPTHTVFMKARC